MATCPQTLYSQCSSQKVLIQLKPPLPQFLSWPLHYLLTAAPNPSTPSRAPTVSLLFQKDPSLFAALGLCTDHSLFSEISPLAVSGSQHHLTTSMMAHLRQSFPIFPELSFLLASVTANNHHLTFSFVLCPQQVVTTLSSGDFSHLGPKTLTSIWNATSISGAPYKAVHPPGNVIRAPSSKMPSNFSR